MTHRLAICLAIASLTFAAPQPAAAFNVSVVYDTVDAVLIHTDSNVPTVVVTGIRAGATVPSNGTFTFAIHTDLAARCERLAVIAMSKPGKFQFAIGADFSTSSSGGCKLILVTP